MTIPHPAWRAWTAVAAAYLLVLQVLVMGIAGGAHAAPLSLDHVVTVMCGPSAHGGTALPVDGGPAPHQSPSCCVLGCSMFGPGAAPPPASWSHVRHPLAGAADTVSVRPLLVRWSAHGASPGLPRAPPGMA